MASVVAAPLPPRARRVEPAAVTALLAIGCAVMAAAWPEGAEAAAFLLLLGVAGTLAAWRVAAPEDRVALPAWFVTALLIRAAMMLVMYVTSEVHGDHGFLPSDDRYWYVVGQTTLRALQNGVTLPRLLREGIWVEYVDEMHPEQVEHNLGYALLQVGVFKLQGHLLVQLAINCAVGASMVILAYLISRRLSGRGRAAAAVVALTDGVFYSAINYRDVYIAFFTTLAMLGALRLGERWRTLDAIGVAGTIVVLFLFRPIGAAIAIVAVAAIYLSARAGPKVARRWLRIGLIAMPAGIAVLALAATTLPKLLNVNATGDLFAFLAAQYIIFQRNTQATGVFNSIYSAAQGDPRLFVATLVTAGSVLSVLRPPFAGVGAGWFAFPWSVVWWVVFVPAWLIGIVRVYRNPQSHAGLVGAMLAYTVALVLTSPMTAFYGARYIHPMIAIEGTVIGIGFASAQPWLRAKRAFWHAALASLVVVYLALRLR